ncbi:MAG: DUF11 domain-containing protein, partial [Gemmatimonadota bacterium]|nr:DUF11 domain-containing protein [Gemmatimonadota bacterium]
PRAISPITVTDYASFGTVTAARDLRIRIPTGFPMTWETGDVAATLGGSAAGKVSPTVSYENGGRTLWLDVLTDFVPGDVLTISDLSYANFTTSAALNRLELVLAGAGAGTAAQDLNSISVGAATISSATYQTFVVGSPATPISLITITDDPVAPKVTAGGELRIRIPAGFNMVWNTAVTTVTLGGSAASKVKTTLKNYEDGGKTAVVDVDVNFAAGDQLTISGLQFMNFTAPSAPDRLGLDVNNDKFPDAFDDKTKTIIAGGLTYGVVVTPDSTAVTQLPTNGTNYTTTFNVKNTGNTPDGFDLVATTTPGTAITVVSITGPGVTPGGTPSMAERAALAPGDSVVVTVTYSVAAAGVGTVDQLVFTARSQGNAAVEDDGKLLLTVSGPRITISRAVNPNGTVPPGTDLTYTVTVTNSGSEDAVNVVAVDSLAAELEFKVGSVSDSLPAGVTVSVQYSDDGGATWAYTPASLGCGAPTDYDGCVTHIRLALQNVLGSVAPDNTGSFEYVARIK